MDEGRKVWVPDPVNGYIVGCIKDIGTDTISVEPRSTPGKTVTAPYAVSYTHLTLPTKRIV